MKIDLITLNAVKNYGSVLQALATQKFFESFNCNVTVINYIRKDITDENILKTWCGNNFIKKMILYPTIKKQKKIFNSFNENHLNLTQKKYTYLEEFNKYDLNADMYCTGSDQVWNSEWNQGIELPLYLSFVTDDKYKFAFSASFGQTTLSDNEVKETEKYIQKYKYISCRENSGVEILKKQYKYKNANQIIDPTLIMNNNFWKKYASKRLIDNDYILIYNLNRSKSFDDYAKKLSKLTGLKLVRLCTRYDQFYRVGKSIFIPDISEFISLINNATYVLTDSFHATAFSINMHTEPICVLPSNFGNRIESFLKLMNIENRKIQNYNDFSQIESHIDFFQTEKILNRERLKAKKFFEHILMDAEKFYGGGNNHE